MVQKKKKSTSTFEQLFKGDNKKHAPAEINWLLDVGQADMRGLSGEQRLDFLYKKIYEFRLFRKGRSKTPPDVIIDFYSPMVEGKAKLQTYLPVFNSAAEKIKMEGNVNDFHIGLSNFIVDMRSIKNKKSESFLSVSTPVSLSLDLQGDNIQMVYGWSDYKTFGPYILATLLKGYPVKALKTCPHCKRIFFTTHHKKKHCSEQCVKAERSISTDKDIIKNRLKSRRAYLANESEMEDNADIAKRLKEDGFIETMRNAGFTKSEIETMVPTSGKYQRKKKKKRRTS